MADPATSSSSAPETSSSSAPVNSDKPVIVRVKRKTYQSPLEAFWLEINERPLKRPLLDFEKLSINESSSKVVELKPKKLFVQHVDTVCSSDVAVDILQSFVASKPKSANGVDTKAKLEDQRRSNKTDNKQKQLLVKAKETQEILAKNARFKQIWKSRKGKDAAESDDALRDMYHFYDVERIDAGETSVVQEEDDEEDQRLVSSFLPLLQEFIPSAAEEIESQMDYPVIKQEPKDEYVYDLYAVKDGDISMMDEDTLNPFPFVKVDDTDDFYDGPDNSDYETDDSNAEDNPLNDYPDEVEEDEDEEEEDSSESSDENSEESESGSSISESLRDQDLSEDDMYSNVDEDDMYNVDEDDETYW